MEMKKGAKKLLSIMLTLAMVTGMIPYVPAGISDVYAANATVVYIVDTPGGTTETVVADTTDTTGGWSWVADTATLTLEGFNGEYIEADGDINIVLKGANTITLPAAPTEDSVYGIRTTEGSINIKDDGEEGKDSLTVTQTGFTKTNVYVYGLYASYNLIVENCNIIVNFAGADSATEHSCYTRCGLGASNGSTYFKGSASLDIDISEALNNFGILRALYAQTTGTIDINIYDAYTGDTVIDDDAEGCGGLYASGTGTVNISAPSGEAIDGPIELTADTGNIAFKGKLHTYNLNTSNISEVKRFIVTGDESAKCGFAPVDYTNYELMKEDGTRVTDGRIETVNANPLTFADSTTFDMGDLKVGDSVRISSLIGMVSGGTKPYTFSVDENYPLPAGMSIYRTDGYISGSPTEEKTAGFFRVVVTDAASATAYIDINYGTITNPPKYITVDGTSITTDTDNSGSGWSYAGDTRTLTLEGYDGGSIISEEELNIVLKGANTITLPATPTGDYVYGIRTTEGSINIKDDGEEGEDSLTVTQTGFAKKYVYVYGLYASYNLIVENCNIIINLAGADPATEHSCYSRYGLGANNGSTYFKGSASLDIDISEAVNTFGILRGLHAQTTGTIDINIYDAYTEDTVIDDDAQGCGGLYASGTGTVNISAPSGRAIYGPIELAADTGNIAFKGKLRTYNLNISNISEVKRFIVTGDESAKCGFAPADYNDYELMKEDGTRVTDGRIETVNANPLTFADSTTFDMGDLKVGDSVRISSLIGMVSGGTKPYTFSVDENYPLPAGMSISRTSGYISGSPTEEKTAGFFRVVVTDAASATAYIDINYGTINVKEPITGVALNKNELSLELGKSETLTATITPNTASVQTVSWSSQDSSIASVDSNGMVNGRKTGKTTVTVTTTQGKFTDSCTVYIKENTPKATVESDYIKNLVANADYTINGAAVTTDAKGWITIENAWRETTVSIIKTNSEVKCNSDAQNLYIPKKEAVDISTISGQFSLDYTEVPYDGNTKEPAVSVSGLTLDTDYTVAYSDNINAGTAKAIITGKGDYYGTFNKYFTITPIDLTGVTATDYSGTYDKVGHTFTLSGVPEGAIVSYSETQDGTYISTKPIRVDAGTTVVYFKVKAQNYNTFNGSARIEILPASIEGKTAALEENTYTYDGAAKEPEVTVTGVVKDTDYTVEYTDNVKAGTASAHINGKGNYTGTIELEFSINPKSITPEVSLETSEYTYDGTEKTPAVTVKDGNTLLTSEDYTVAYAPGRKNVGTYSVTVTLKGNYTGSKAVSFSINPKSITPEVSLKTSEYTYDGKVKTPSVTVKDGNTLLTSEDYTVAYAPGRKNVGAYSVTVTLKGNYTGSKAVSFRIVPKKITPSVKLSATSYTYNGKVKTPAVTVKDDKGRTLVKNTDYTVSYSSGRKNPGQYQVKVVLKGNYSGTVTKTFTIKPKATALSSLKAGTRKLTVKWKKLTTQTTGYQIQYSTSSKFKGAKTVTVTKNKTTSKTITKLKAKKKYYVRIRTYKTVKVNGKSVKLYSSWSKAKSVKTK